MESECLSCRARRTPGDRNCTALWTLCVTHRGDTSQAGVAPSGQLGYVAKGGDCGANFDFFLAVGAVGEQLPGGVLQASSSAHRDSGRGDMSCLLGSGVETWAWKKQERPSLHCPILAFMLPTFGEGLETFLLKETGRF